MTVKQIAESVGKDASTVARWVQATSCKMQEVSRKMQEAGATKKPADYTLEETCSIIEQGMGQAAAYVYRTNAVHAEMNRKAPKITGSLLAEVNKAFDRGIMTKDEARVMIGLSSTNQPVALPAPAPMPLLSKQAYAVEMANRAKAQAKAITEAKTPQLF